MKTYKNNLLKTNRKQVDHSVSSITTIIGLLHLSRICPQPYKGHSPYAPWHPLRIQDEGSAARAGADPGLPLCALYTDPIFITARRTKSTAAARSCRYHSLLCLHRFPHHVFGTGGGKAWQYVRLLTLSESKCTGISSGTNNTIDYGFLIRFFFIIKK